MFGDSRAVNSQPRRKHKQHKRRISPADRLSALRYEQLEERLALSSNPILSIPTTLVGARGGVVNVPINVNQLTDNLAGSLRSAFNGNGNTSFDPAALAYVNCTRAGLSSADFAVDFDPNVFSVSKSDVHLGTIPANVVAFFPFSIQPNSNPPAIGWTVTVTFSTANPGQMLIHIAASNLYANITSTTATSTPTAVSDTAFPFPSSTPTGPVVGSIESLVTIDFHVRPNAPVGKSQINLAASNAAGARPTELFDATGRKYALAPTPTNSSADIGVDGTLTVIPTAPALGTWTAVTPLSIPPNILPPPDPSNPGLGTMLLLPDGSVMANGGLNNTSPDWFKLTPDSNGSYANGTWTQLASMSIGRLFYGSVVMQDGRVMVLGGEYTSTSFGQAEDPTGEIYDPATNTWTAIASFPQPLFDPNILSQNPPPAQIFGDGQLELMSDGSVLAGFLGYVYGTTQSPTFRYYPGQDLWVQDAALLNSDKANEESWVKLPDGSMLAYQVFGTNPGSAERLVFGDTPADDRWVPAGHVPVNLMTNANVHAELGSANLLPDGRVFYLGATNNTALYTPPSPGHPNGSWVAGPNIPFGLGANDCPAAVLPDGRVLFQAGPTPTFGAGSHLFEYDPVTNSITPVNNLPPALAASLADPTSPSGAGGFNGRMLVLPNLPNLPSGQLMLSDSTGQAYVYTPAGAPQDSWRPTISNIEQTTIKLDPVTLANVNVYTLTGTQLNGLSEGAVYGDDAQMATNYPVIELFNTAGNVVFATTSNWSSAWVATGSTPQSVDFTLPAGTTLGDYVSLRVIANGISSFPTNQTIMLGTSTTAESLIIRVDPANAGLVDIVNAATNTTITTHPNNSNWGTINIVGDASNNVVTIDESNGIVNAPVNFNGGGAGSPANDQLVVIGVPASMTATGNDNLVISPTSATTGGVTDNGSATYSYENISKVLFDGQTGKNAVAVVDTIGGGASIDVNSATVDYDGGTPFFLSNTQTLSVNDNSKLGGDTINVLGTTIATTVGSTAGAGGDTITVVSDAPSNQFGDLTGITANLTVATGAGHNTLLVSDIGSSAAGLTFGLTNKQITATDMPKPIAYTNGTGTLNIVLDGSDLVATIFDVASTLPATSTVTLNGGAVDGNSFNIGSTALANNGKLNSIGAAITVNGGGGAGNALEVDDHGTVGAYNYNVTDTTVSYDLPTSPAGASFGGVTYSDIATLQLDATEQPNKIAVSPSFTTVDTINGHGQLGGSDSLGINTTNVTGPVTNNKTPAGPGSFNGNFTFTDGHQTVNYTDIEQFPTIVNNPQIVVYGADSGPTSEPFVKVVDARTGQLLNPSQPQGFLAYEPTYHGGVRVAVGYFDTTGQQEIAVAPGAGHTPIIKIFDLSGDLLYQFQAYATSMSNGVNIAAGNVEAMSSGGHEIDDLVTSPSRGVSDIRVFHNRVLVNPAVPFIGTPIREFTAWGKTFAGGSSVAVADLNADGRGDIVLGSGPGMVPLIEVFDVTIPRASYSPFKIFYPFVSTFHGGVNVSAINPGNNNDITAPMVVASQAAGGSGQVVVLNGNSGGIRYGTTITNGGTGVRTTAKIIDGRFYVFAGQPTNGLFSKILKIDPLAPSVVDFLIDTDPSFGRFFLG